MRSITTLATVFLLCAPIAVWAAGPGDHHHAVAYGEPGDAKAKARTIEIKAGDNMRYNPDRLTIKLGETIRFVLTNGGELKHEMVLGTRHDLEEHAELMQKFPEMEHEDPNAITVLPGKKGEFLWKFTNAGTFYFGCLAPGHFENGMKGTIVVSR